MTLEWVGNGVAGEAIGTAEWQGVRLKSLLDKATVTSQTQDVVFHAAEGYSDSLTIERAIKDSIMVAYRMNGVPLSLGHRFPARMIEPGHFDMKHVQWLTGIELDSSDNKGYYQGTDWSDEAIVKTKSWIMDPQPRYPNHSEGVHHAGLCLCEILGDLSGGHQHRRRRILVGRDPCPFIFYPGPCGAIHGNHNGLLTIVFWLERLVERENNNPRKNIRHFRMGHPAGMK